jgi:hypothetical protein
LIAVLAVAMPILAAPVLVDAADGSSGRTLRGQLVHQIVSKWGGHVQEAYRADVREWAMGMVPIFARTPIPALRRAASAPSFAAMNDMLLGADTLAPSVASPKALGDPDKDLVFVPVTPCRIFDTRLAGGPIAANTTRGFDVTAVSNYSFQGGDASNCGVGDKGSFAAAAINFTVVTPGSGGYMTAFPFGATQPLAATVNYTAGDIRGNLSIVRLDQGPAANELSVYSFAQTHVVADIVGYFTQAETELDCVEKISGNLSVGPGGFNSGSSPICDAGYRITGGGCTMSTFDGRMVSSRSISDASGDRHFCAFRNESTTATLVGIAYARCCRN